MHIFLKKWKKFKKKQKWVVQIYIEGLEREVKKNEEKNIITGVTIKCFKC